jgi:site-specific recombinase XerD
MAVLQNNQRTHLIQRLDITHQIRDFLTDRRARGLSSRTVAFYEEKLGIVARCLEEAGVTEVREIRPTTVRRLLLDLGETHNAGGVHAVYRSLRAFLNWWAAEVEPEGWRNPLAKVKAPRLDEPPLEPVSLEDLGRMLDTCQPRTFHGERDRALMLFLLDSGCRRGEVHALDVGHVNLGNGSVLIVRGKGGKMRVAFVGAKTRRALVRYLRERGAVKDSDPLWVTTQGGRLSLSSLREVIRRRAERAGVAEPSLHAFRRGFAISALRAGCDLITLQRMLGHSSLAVVSRYLKQVEDDLREAHQRVGPVDHLL